MGNASTAAGSSDVVAFFGGFPRVILVANSEAVDIASLKARYGADALYVFFNKVFKVLSEPFDYPSLLVARSSPAGANIVYRGEVETVLALLTSSRFSGILNLRAANPERFSEAAEFGGAETRFLDLAGYFDDFYPASHVPTSGFALALWLSENCPATEIVLAGFTARRSPQWKLFHDHDWTFEQIVQRLLVRGGRLVSDAGVAGDPFVAIAKRLPGVSPADVALVAADVLSERLEGSNVAIDRLYSLTRLQSRMDGFLRRLKPKTRKQKLAERQNDQTRG